MKDSMDTALKKLRLSGLAQTLEVRLQEASGNHLTHTEFLELILQDELTIRQDRLIQRRVKAAGFREMRTLEDFDWQFNPTIKRKQVFDLATCRFIKEGKDVLLLGPPGVGKSHLVQAIGHQAIKAGYVVLYRSIFDLVRDFLQDEAGGGPDRLLTVRVDTRITGGRTCSRSAPNWRRHCKSTLGPRPRRHGCSTCPTSTGCWTPSRRTWQQRGSQIATSPVASPTSTLPPGIRSCRIWRRPACIPKQPRRWRGIPRSR